jgi:glycosyltransferase involved in cell wall biosynthesis
MKVAYVTTYDPLDRRHSSGSGHCILRSLAGQNIEIVPLGPLVTEYQDNARQKIEYYERLGKRFEYEREKYPCEQYAKQLQERIGKDTFDIVLTPGTLPVSRLSCTQPIVIWVDGTFKSYAEDYGLFQSHCAETILAGCVTEQLAFQRSSLLIFTSGWAAKSAIEDYGMDPAKVKVVPFGANFLHPPSRAAAIRAATLRSTGNCRLISIGIDWRRKGMERSIDLCKIMNQRGTPTKLTIVGCAPPNGYEIPEFVELIPFLDKNDPENEAKLSAVYLSSHFNVLLTSAETFGVVFCEASAHGVPNISSDVGGISAAVTNGVNGQRFDLSTPMSDIAAYLENCLKDKAGYLGLVNTTLDQYYTRLNWGSAGDQVKLLLNELMNKRKAARFPNLASAALRAIFDKVRNLDIGVARPH